MRIIHPPRVQPVGQPPARLEALVLVLHGGRAHSHARAHRLRLAYLRMLALGRMLTGAGREHGVGVWMVRYRYRGWNGVAMDGLWDAEEALRHARQLHPTVPVVLLGHSMGARAALRAAGHPAVRAICGLAPWLEPTDPVEQLFDRTVLIVHGDQDRVTDPRMSYSYAVSAKAITNRVCRFEVHGDGHAMLRRRQDWRALVRRFVLGELGAAPPDAMIADALAQPAPGGLRVALPPRSAEQPDGQHCGQSR